MLWLNLLRPLAYRVVRHPQIAGVRDRAPALCAVIFGGIYVLLPGEAKLIGADSLARFAFNLVLPLPGFFVAALAAIATFDRKEMDYEMPAPAPTVSLATRGEFETVQLTFRMFIGYIFAYLSVISLVGAGVVGVADLVNSPLSELAGQLLRDPSLLFAISRTAFAVGTFWLLFDILFSTLLGLFFLVERIHRPHA